MDASRRLWPRSDLRVGDADRQAVVVELQRHFIDGRLTSEELGERVTQTLNSKTFADLAALLTDLPVLPASEPERQLATADQNAGGEDWHTHLFAHPLGAILVLVGIFLLLSMLMFPIGGRMGFFPFWPIFIWGFFFMSRPYRGGRRF